MKVKSKYERDPKEIAVTAVGYWNSTTRKSPSEILGLLTSDNEPKYFSSLDDELRDLKDMRQFKVILTVELL